VVEGEPHGLGAVAMAAPGRRPRQQQLISDGAGLDVVELDDDVIQARDHTMLPVEIRIPG
jgi:hypothetical protein